MSNGAAGGTAADAGGGALRAGDQFRMALAAAGTRTLVTDHEGRTRTGAELSERIGAVAATLADRGLAGRRVGLWYRNGIAAFEAFLATEWIGATRVAVDPEIPAGEARSVFDAAGVDGVVSDTEHAAGLPVACLVHDTDTAHTAGNFTDVVTVDADRPLVIYPRSVSGGELFGVATSYGNWDAIMRINVELFRAGWYGPPVQDDDTAMTMQQLMHGTGMVTSFPFLLMGLPQVTVPKFHGPTVVRILHQAAVTTTFGVPGMLSRVADALDEVSGPLPLRRFLYGGAPLPVDELRRVSERLAYTPVQLYGRFEAGWPLAVLGQEEHRRIGAGDDELATSCGRFIPQIEARLAPVESAPEKLAAGAPHERGELQTRNPMVSPEFADPAGWCALGDIASLDGGGYLHLHGRLDGMINTGSYHVYPQQVADAIQTTDGVVAVKVVGEPDPVWGQAVTAYVVAAQPDQWDGLVATLRAELPDRIARYKIPKAFHRVDAVAELPS